jgi:hypothetical protein
MCRLIREQPGYKMRCIAGDQAFQKSVVGRLLARPAMFASIVAFCDWFHVLCWVLCAVWDLCRENCLYWFVIQLKHEHLGKKEVFRTFNIKDKVNHYEHGV